MRKHKTSLPGAKPHLGTRFAILALKKQVKERDARIALLTSGDSFNPVYRALVSNCTTLAHHVNTLEVVLAEKGELIETYAKAYESLTEDFKFLGVINEKLLAIVNNQAKTISELNLFLETLQRRIDRWERLTK